MVHLNPVSLIKELEAELAELKQYAEKVKRAFHVNMVRAFPEKSHEEIAFEIEKACL